MQSKPCCPGSPSCSFNQHRPAARADSSHSDLAPIAHRPPHDPYAATVVPILPSRLAWTGCHCHSVSRIFTSNPCDEDLRCKHRTGRLAHLLHPLLQIEDFFVPTSDRLPGSTELSLTASTQPRLEIPLLGPHAYNHISLLPNMRSPAPGEVMDITNMLNNKGMHHQQALPGHLPLIKADPIIERSVSPHGSEHSHYSSHSLARSYSSQGLPGPLHMSAMQNGIPLPGYPDMHGMNGMPHMQMPAMVQQGHEQPMPQLAKAYACSTCSKGFARRSDLARHGMLLELSRTRRSRTLTCPRTHP